MLSIIDRTQAASALANEVARALVEACFKSRPAGANIESLCNLLGLGLIPLYASIASDSTTYFFFACD
jgi:acetylglutamate kinase